jgi:hypothetical protein
MSEFFKWLSSNPTATTTVIFSFGFIVISIGLIFLIAFFQGREISVWPPKIGAKSNQGRTSINLEGKISLSDRGGYDTPFEKLLENTRKVDFLGVSLVGIVVHYEAFLVQKAKSGCKMRFLIIDPDSSTINVNIVGFWDKNPENRKADVRRSIRTIKHLANIGNVELRTTTVSIPYSIIIKDKDTKFNQATVQVELYGYDVSPSELPHFFITAADNEAWYAYFVQQYENLWKDGKPFDFSTVAE